MKLKRVLCVLMASVMVIGTAACGSGDSKDKDAQGSGTEGTDQQEDTTGDDASADDEGNAGEDAEAPEEDAAGDDASADDGPADLTVAAVETAYGADPAYRRQEAGGRNYF